MEAFEPADGGGAETGARAGGVRGLAVGEGVQGDLPGCGGCEEQVGEGGGQGLDGQEVAC